MENRLSVSVENYLKAIHHLGGDQRLVAPVEIAAELGVRAPSVTGMLKRLANAGWIEYEAGAGAKLSAEGLAAARRVIRRHRLVELFLTNVLGLDWSEVDTEAEALEHAISPRLEQALAAYLGEPLEDPHGHLIPMGDGTIPERKLCELSELRPGQSAVIREVRDDDPRRLRHWQAHGLIPGACVTVRHFQPLDDLFEIDVSGKVVRLGSEGLAGLRGERL
jgi:DtxR family Mn-dependent transcriptional regulator